MRTNHVEMRPMQAQGQREDNFYDEYEELPEANSKERTRESIPSYYVE